ncbi:MAG: tetratricopeptide repeat protein [Bacteroidota bacterium]|nr:tetratricopeptide repeat protein [Bacteroidota bacterium]
MNTVLAIAQENDTLTIVKELNAKEQYTKSITLLQSYYPRHKNDQYAGWLYAQTLHYSDNYAESQRIYKYSIQQFPGNNDIKLDLINKLVELGELSEAIIQINLFLPDFTTDYKFVAHKTLAQVFYWKGDYDRSIAEIDRALAICSNDKPAIDLKNEISMARSNWINFDISHFTDDQPLTKFNPTISSGFYVSSRLSLGLDVDHNMYTISDSSYSTTWIKASAKFSFLEKNAGLKVEFGTINYPSKEKSITGMIELNKKLTKHLNVVFGASYQPYLATTYSVKEKLMQTQYGAAFEWNNPNGFIGRASIDNKLFSDIDNSYYTASGWLVFPPLKIKKFDFRVGYGINYSDSKSSNFESMENLSDILAVWDSTYEIAGNYNPFFTPNKQLIHTAVGLAEYSPNKKLTLTFDISYGFSAKSNAPYLYLDNNSEGEIIIARDFAAQNYKPMDSNISIYYKISDSFSLKGYYRYKKTYYYESKSLGIIARIVF